MFNNEIHNYNTRSASNIHLPRVDTGYGQRSVCYVGVSLWNSLPDDLKTITSFSTFKDHVKFYLQTKSYLLPYVLVLCLSTCRGVGLDLSLPSGFVGNMKTS